MCISVVIPYLKHCWNTLNFPKLRKQTDPCSSPCVLWWEKSVWKHCWVPAIKPCSVLGPLKNFLFGGTSCPSGCPGQPSLCPLGREEWAGNVDQCLTNTGGRGWGRALTHRMGLRTQFGGGMDPQRHKMTSGSCHQRGRCRIVLRGWVLQMNGSVVGQLGGTRDLGPILQGKAKLRAVLISWCCSSCIKDWVAWDKQDLGCILVMPVRISLQEKPHYPVPDRRR